MLTAAVVFSLSALLLVSGKEAEKSVQKSKMEGSPFVWYLVQQVDKLQYEVKDLQKKMPLAENSSNCSREVGKLNTEIKNQRKLSQDLTAKVVKLEKELRKKNDGKDLTAKVTKLEKDLRRKNGRKGDSLSTYIHWGRSDCSKGSTLVYSGYVGGNYYHRGSNYYRGGPANTLCLPKEPIYASYSTGITGYSAIYGAEYEDIRTSPNINRLRYHDVPCAVCQTKGESVIMIPARNECYRGWKVKYWGYLMSDHYGHTASEYICVDRNAETTTGGKERKNGRFLYLVESRCGSLPCPPYIDGYEITCVVCSY